MLPIDALFKTGRQSGHIGFIGDAPHLVLVQIGVVRTDLIHRKEGVRKWVERGG